VDASLFSPREKAGALQDPEVLGDGRKRHLEGAREVRHRGVREGEPRQDRPARRVGEGGKSAVQRSGIVNHKVNY